MIVIFIKLDIGEEISTHWVPRVGRKIWKMDWIFSDERLHGIMITCLGRDTGGTVSESINLRNLWYHNYQGGENYSGIICIDSAPSSPQRDTKTLLTPPKIAKKEHGLLLLVDIIKGSNNNKLDEQTKETKRLLENWKPGDVRSREIPSRNFDPTLLVLSFISTRD